MMADESREQDASEWSWLHSLVELSRGGATDAVHVKVRTRASSRLSEGWPLRNELGLPVWAHKNASGYSGCGAGE
jgi:hypothetical protein